MILTTSIALWLSWSCMSWVRIRTVYWTKFGESTKILLYYPLSPLLLLLLLLRVLLLLLLLPVLLLLRWCNPRLFLLLPSRLCNRLVVDSESHPSNSRTSYSMRFSRIKPSTNRWRTAASSHRHDDIYVFMIDDHCVDYPSIAKPAETAEKPPPPFNFAPSYKAVHQKSMKFNLLYYTTLKTRV
ncbi:hypothetical protein F5880DRAFT_650786 [Lentinula raphanica]|nr:hypothetical protein F5880DRAFT_650786 [Lentinula raphanica]